MTHSVFSIKISVIIPVYNVDRFIASALQSVLDQTYRDFEVIVVDDGSPDRSVEICRQFVDPRIKIIRQNNRGLSGARNTGIRHAKGEYIAFLDGDDVWLPDKLSQHIRHLEKFPLVGVSFSFSEFMDEHGNRLDNYVITKTDNITLSDLFRTNPVGNGSAAVMRRQTIDAIGFTESRHGLQEKFYFDEDLSRNEDYEILLRIMIQTHWEIAGIQRSLTLYRVNPSGLSANLDQQKQAWEQVLAKTSRYAPEIIEYWKKISMAYHLRYLARSAVRLKKGSQAVSLIHLSLLNYGRIVWEEPRRTIQILLVAHALNFLPSSLYLTLAFSVIRN
jgi:glycosyltransferase involved in cell wall biosynthesis